MKTQRIKKTLVTATAASVMLISGAASAQSEGDSKLMLGFNPFGASALTGSLNQVSATAPQYMVGMRVNDQLMPYAYAAIADPGGNADTAIGFGGGARLYLDNISNNLRPYAGAAVGIINQDDTGFGMGGFFGAEAMITDAVSVSGQIGAEVGDRGCRNCDTQVTLGTANVMFNFYF
jgi:hypothetical protein